MGKGGKGKGKYREEGDTDGLTPKEIHDLSHQKRWEDPLTTLVREVLEPVIHLDTTWTLDVAEKRVTTYLWKGSKSFNKDMQDNDWRLNDRNGAMSAQYLIYDFIVATFGAISAGCYDKQWYWEANWMPVLNYWVFKKLGESKCLSSVLKPFVERYVEESFTRFRDEERIQACFEKALEQSGLAPGTHKKAHQLLNKCFLDAFRGAPYGKSQNPDMAVRMLEDFYFGWMESFVHRGGVLLGEGVGEDPQSQAPWIFALFQAMAGPTYRVMPFDIGQLFALDETKLPGEEWKYVMEVTQAIFEEGEQPAAQPAAQPAKGAGKGARTLRLAQW